MRHSMFFYAQSMESALNISFKRHFANKITLSVLYFPVIRYIFL